MCNIPIKKKNIFTYITYNCKRVTTVSCNDIELILLCNYKTLITFTYKITLKCNTLKYLDTVLLI